MVSITIEKWTSTTGDPILSNYTQQNSQSSSPSHCNHLTHLALLKKINCLVTLLRPSNPGPYIPILTSTLAAFGYRIPSHHYDYSFEFLDLKLSYKPLLLSNNYQQWCLRALCQMLALAILSRLVTIQLRVSAYTSLSNIPLMNSIRMYCPII